ncbi:MAG TPA: histidine phosphatase family protein [Methylocystis sp.]|nr:histidine phosphatase family protein [Methylocystis sp.]
MLTILIIRHAEKPGEAWPGPGYDGEGVEDKKSLVIRGWQRAGAWAAQFGAGLGGADYPQPGAIYAARPETDDEGPEPSARPYETIIPLSARLKLDPNVDFAKTQGKELAARLIQAMGVVLVSWEHKAIVEDLLPALVGDQHIDGLPTEWKEDRFDAVLRLDRPAPDARWSFRQLSPQLLSGDSNRPVDKRSE